MRNNLKQITQTVKPFVSSWPVYSSDEIDAVSAVLRSGKVNYWTGQQCTKFEEEFADYWKVKHALTVANGTVALELALNVLGIDPGDEVIVTPRSFIASASSIVTCGAKPVFADVDPISQNITAETILKVITPKTKAIITVHLAGWPCDMDPIMELARKYNLKVIEDCAQAHGARYKNYLLGSIGHIAAFSFCQDKIMSTGGEGGMLITNDQELWQKAWSYRDHGKSYTKVFNQSHPPGFRWVHESFGSNLRMTETQAAIGRNQLSKLSKWVEHRRHNASILNKYFHSIPALRVCEPPPESFHAFYKYYVFVRDEVLPKECTRDHIMNTINKQGVPCFSGTCPEIYREKAFNRQTGHIAERLQNAHRLGQTSLMFPIDPTLGKKEMNSIGIAVENAMLDLGIY